MIMITVYKVKKWQLFVTFMPRVIMTNCIEQRAVSVRQMSFFLEMASRLTAFFWSLFKCQILLFKKVL